MGGVYFTLADFAFAVASNWQGDTMVSLNSQIAYLGAAKGNMLIAEAVCLKDGRTTAYYEIRIKDELGNTAAEHDRLQAYEIVKNSRRVKLFKE